jgi:hypothetical protein
MKPEPRADVEQRRQARGHDSHLRSQVEAGRAAMRAGRGRSNDEVEKPRSPPDASGRRPDVRYV